MAFTLHAWHVNYDGRDGLCGSSGKQIGEFTTYEEAFAAKEREDLLDGDTGGEAWNEIHDANGNTIHRSIQTTMLDNLCDPNTIPF